MNIRFLCVFIFWLALNAPQTLWSQKATIFGKVLSENEELPFATVTIRGDQKGATTDLNGQYRLGDLEPGTYELIASFVGYIPVKRKIDLKSGSRMELNFELTSSEALQEVVVTGNMKPTYVSNSPIKIEVVTSKQLDTYLPSAASSIMESAQLVSGVQEVVDCGICQTNGISVNGLPGSYTAILMDGTPIYGSLASIYGLNGIPNMIIDRFEVIKGPNSTLYGSEAVAGVINVITKNPANQPLLSADLMTTSHEEIFSNIALAPSIGKTDAYIGLNYNYGNHYQDVNDDGFGDGVLTDRVSLFSKFQVYRKSGKRFSIAAKYYFEDRRNGVEEFVKNRAYKQLRGSDRIYGESIYTNRAELFGTYALNTDQDLRIDYSFSNHLQDSYYGSDRYKASQQIAFGNFIWNFNKGRHDVLMGATLRYDAYDDTTVATEEETEDGNKVNRPNNQFVPGIFVQDEYLLTEKFTALGGMRMDHHSEHGLIFAPRLNLKFKASDWTTFRFNFGTGFKVVNLFTEDHAFVQGQREVVITEQLKPEKSVNLSLNLHHVYTGMAGSGSIDVEGFFTRFTNKIIPDYSIAGKIVYANSNGQADSSGLSVNLNHNFSFPFSLGLGVNFLRSVQKEKDSNGNTNVENLLFAPEISGVLTANYRLSRQAITLAYTLQYTGKMSLPEVFDLDDGGSPLPYARPTESKPFSLHQFQVTKSFRKGYNLYIGMNNLFDFVQKQSPLVGYDDPNHHPGFSPYFDTSYAYAPNHGREIYLGLRWDLSKNKGASLAER